MPRCAETLLVLRRERDSNPRYSCPYNGFRDRPIRPLWHLSLWSFCKKIPRRDSVRRKKRLVLRSLAFFYFASANKVCGALKTKTPAQKHGIDCLRRERDSNPRTFWVNGFQDRRFKPLSHLSAAKIQFEINWQKIDQVIHLWVLWLEVYL